MFEVLTTDEFDRWLLDLADERARTKIASRVARLRFSNAGDAKPVGEGVSEMRVHHGPGYRVYYKQTNKTIIVMLCGGDKSTQEKDVRRAKKMAAEL
jgi:putative addiction module killer protein